MARKGGTGVDQVSAYGALWRWRWREPVRCRNCASTTTAPPAPCGRGARTYCTAGVPGRTARDIPSERQPYRAASTTPGKPPQPIAAPSLWDGGRPPAMAGHRRTNGAPPTRVPLAGKPDRLAPPGGLIAQLRDRHRRPGSCGHPAGRCAHGAQRRATEVGSFGLALGWQAPA